MDLAKSGQSYNKHIQTISSKRAAEEIQGINNAHQHTFFAYKFLGTFLGRGEDLGRIQKCKAATEGKEYG